jgi:hypothetical protein
MPIPGLPPPSYLVEVLLTGSPFHLALEDVVASKRR